MNVEPAVAPRGVGGGGGGHGGGGGSGGGASYFITPWCSPTVFDTIVGVGVNALHVAVAQKSNERIVKLLLAHPRVDVNSMNGVGTTVLHMAAAKNNLEVVKMILAEPKFTTANAMGEQDRSVC